jgi:DNA gyrase subunit A
VEGLLVAISGKDFLDHIIATIRASKDPEEARWALQNINSPALYEAPSFKNLPKFNFANAKKSMDAIAARAAAAE